MISIGSGGEATLKNRILLSALLLCLFLSGCGEGTEPHPARQQQPASAITESMASSAVSPQSAEPSASSISGSPAPWIQLKPVLAKYTTYQILFFQGFSLNGNQTAAFATDDGGEVWYVTDTGAQKLKTGLSFSGGNPSAATFLWTVNGVTIFKCEDNPGGSSTRSYAWYVKDDEPVELPYTGMQFSYLGGGRFTAVGDTFDSVFTDGLGAGHTYKIYYLYWAGGGLKEYGGLKITQRQLLKIKGARPILDTITGSGHTVDDIYYRANHIININYHLGDQKNGNFDNVTLVYQNNIVVPKPAEPNSGSLETESFSEKNLQDFSYGGSYQAALFPKIAVYPDKLLAD